MAFQVISGDGLVRFVSLSNQWLIATFLNSRYWSFQAFFGRFVFQVSQVVVEISVRVVAASRTGTNTLGLKVAKPKISAR